MEPGYTKACPVELDVTLQKEKEGLVLTISGRVWNPNRSDITSGGQCLDYIKENLPQNDTFDFLYDMWKKYHLNDMHAGTPAQEAALRKAYEEGKLPGIGANHYKECCDYLKTLNLYEVNIDGSPYKYGHSWLFEEIPLEDVARIVYLIETDELFSKDDKQYELFVASTKCSIDELYEEDLDIEKDE